MSDIPFARKRLKQIAADAEAAGLEDLAEDLRDVIPLLWRRPYARPAAPVQSNIVDAEMAEQIRQMARDFPEKSQQEIAEFFGTNSGRVSEALHGDR